MRFPTALAAAGILAFLGLPAACGEGSVHHFSITSISTLRNGHGRVTDAGGNIDCPGRCTTEFHCQAVIVSNYCGTITLTETPAPLSIFQGWCTTDGDLAFHTQPATYTIQLDDYDMSCPVNFWDYTLDVLPRSQTIIVGVGQNAPDGQADVILGGRTDYQQWSVTDWPDYIAIRNQQGLGNGVLRWSRNTSGLGVGTWIGRIEIERKPHPDSTQHFLVAGSPAHIEEIIQVIPATLVNIPIITCSIPIQPVCNPPFSQSFTTTSLFKINYSAPTAHCGAITLHVALDSTFKQLTTGAVGPGGTTGDIDLGPVSAGSHKLDLRASGVPVPGGCIPADGSLTQWTGTLLVYTN